MAKTLSLRRRFAVWTSVVVVFSSLGLMASVYFVSSHALKQQADEELDRIVAKTTEELDLWIESQERDAVNLSELQPLVAACTDRKLPDAEQTLVRIQQRTPFYENVFLADPSGKEFLDAIGGKSVGVELMSIPPFRANVEHAQRGELWMAGVVRSPASGRPVALLTAPVMVDKRCVGILGTPIELANFSENFVSKYRIGDTGYLYMFDESGIMLAHPEASKILSFNVGASDFGREMMSRASGSLVYEFEGSAKIAHFQRAQKKPWTIVATVPAKELLAGVRTIQLCLVVFGFATLAATVLAVSVLAGRISQVVRNLADELDAAVRQFFAASSQISNSSQSLAQGASEQAASIEETSASAEEISSITRQNSDRAQKAAQLMNDAVPIVDAVNASHRDLARALTEMSESSEKVAKVIKMIDGIAFQTNILALNAAVEAARAGESGMGFAVVADEVRDLARRSADAARETSGLIEESVLKSRESRHKLEGVLKAMEANNRITGEVKTETDAIRSASEEQSRGIEQISTAITQMSRVTQTTAAQAEESASAAQELDGQAHSLQQIVGRLNTVVSGGESEG
jgi:methyl-accepting chemotaxis protein